MVAWNMGRPWADRTRAYAKSAIKPVNATLLRERPRAFLIKAGTREAWVPKSLVSHDPVKGVFLIPMWLCNQKLLD